MTAFAHPSQGQRDFEARYPRLTAAVNQLCLAQGGGLPWGVTGVSALIWDDEGLWFELAKPKHWTTRPDGILEIGLGGIGGSLEPGESLAACWQREALEEIGMAPALQSATGTALVYEEREVDLAPARDDDVTLPALLTISANRSRRERLPDYPTLAIVTYWARLDQAPRLRDLYGLMRLPLATLSMALQREEWPVSDLTSWPGVESQTSAPLPARAVVKPVWTVRSLQLTLQAGVLSLPDRPR